jgi:hypothetical protein
VVWEKLRTSGRPPLFPSKAIATRAREFDESNVLRPDFRSYLEKEDWEFAQEVIGDEQLEGLCVGLELLLPFGGVPGTTNQVVAVGAYAAAFSYALPELERCLSKASGIHRHPGWDTTLLGYIVKTCRDREMFSSGSIEPSAVTEACIVDRHGSILERISRG